MASKGAPSHQAGGALNSLLATAAVIAGCSSADEPTGQAPKMDDGVISTQSHSEPVPGADVMGVHWTREEHAAREAKAAGGGRHRSPNMTYHGGKIMTSFVSKAIFWGSSWGSYTGDKMTGMDSYYSGFGNSNYEKTTNEYTGTNGGAGNGGTHQGHIVDTSAASGGGNTGTILAEVCKQVSAGAINVDPGGNGYYPVYTDVPRGSAGYCAWHASGTCAASGGTVLQFAFFWKLDGDAGCDPADTSGQHSQGLAAIANVSGHELAEARSDPSTTSATGAGAWYDSQGAENGDKCAWTFNVPLVTFSNSSEWKIQGEWSNKAYNTGTGYPNSSGQRGCLDGH
jgi:hypothetical protein